MKYYIMKQGLIKILCCIALSFLWICCSKNEVLESYQEIKRATEPVPLTFNPYIGSLNEEEANTRADYNYLIMNMTKGNTTNVFNIFPWKNNSNPEIYQRGQKEPSSDNFRFAQNNSWIVGIYGYYDHNWEKDEAITWNELKEDSKLESNFMTNQPLEHLNNSNKNNSTGDNQAYWEYNPKRYWPNSTFTDEKDTSGNNSPDGIDDTPVNVTFISYYPFQDYEDGEYWCAHLENCIEPPAKDATGTDAFTFTFTQKPNVQDHVDFMLGINEDMNDRSVNSNGIDLKLSHTLCAVEFGFRTTDKFKVNDASYNSLNLVINSVSLEGLYGKGKVFPYTYIDNGNTKIGFNWELLGEDNRTYTLSFDDAIADKLFYNSTPNKCMDKPTFSKNNQRVDRLAIYENNYSDKSANYDWVGNNTYANGRGMKYLMLVVPQKVNTDKNGLPKKAYLVVNYDVIIDYKDGSKNIYERCEERIQLQDYEFHNPSESEGQLFKAGKQLSVNVEIKSPQEIAMDAVVESDWGAERPRVVNLPEPQAGDSQGGGEP